MTKEIKSASTSPSLAIVGTGGTANETETSTAPATDARGNPVSYSEQRKLEAAAGDTSLTVIQDSKQLLAEVADITAKAGGLTDEAKTKSGQAALLLFTALSNQRISEEQVTAAVGDVFGYTMKKDGTPGKTPVKAGSAIQKRVFRAAKIANFVNSNGNANGDSLFDNVSLESDDGSETSPVTVASLYAGMISGDIPLFTAYDTFTKIKANSKPKSSPAFDAKRVSALADDLATLDVSVEAFLGNAALAGAWDKLVAVWREVDMEAGRVHAERKAA